MTGWSSELRITRTALPTSAASMRGALRAFLRAVEVDDDFATDIVTAIGEALANAIEHAYEGSDPRDVMLYAKRAPDGTIAAEVADRGRFIERPRRPDRGFGLRIVDRIASDVAVTTDGGTSVRMTFPLQA